MRRVVVTGLGAVTPLAVGEFTAVVHLELLQVFLLPFYSPILSSFRLHSPIHPEEEGRFQSCCSSELPKKGSYIRYPSDFPRISSTRLSFIM